MHPSASPSPSEEYKRRQQARELQVAHFEKVHRRLGNLRLLTVIAALIALWFCLHDQAFSPWWLLVPIAAFIAIAAYHAHILRRRTQSERAVDVYRKGLARIEDRWPGNGQQATPVDISTHLYATDLDIFGPSSLFELLSLARTCMGEETLANWLLAPATIPQIIERQAAVTELRTRLDLREDMATLGPIQGKDLKAGVHPEALANWAEAANQLTNPWLRWLALTLAIAAIAAAVVWAELGTKSPFFAIVIIEGAIMALHLKRIKQIFHSTEHALEDLQLLSSLLARLESEPFETPLLQSLKQQLSSHHIPVSKAITHLKTIVEYIYSLDNPIVKTFDIPLMYSVQVAYAAEAWRRSHGSAVRSWLRAIGDIEALLSLSAFSYEHPADPFPELLNHKENTPPTLIAEAIGHPLIPAAKCVRNDISIANQTRVLLISGSNMSGKSTLMRAIGINTVLAMAGAPVRAQRLQLTALQIGASILINDSLQEGSSRFYAEITRLRHLCDLATKTPPLLFLLDELLQGTNSKDRLTGAEGTVRALLDAGAIGLISTHDLALTNIATNDPRLHNFHLQDDIVDGKMHFDFKLHEGVVTRSNGIELMRLIGLKV